MKKILLIGYGGKTGYYYLRLLLADGFFVYAYDDNLEIKLDADLQDNTQLEILKQINVEEILGIVNMVTLTPGVPLSKEIFIEVKKRRNISFFSELEYCYSFLKQYHWVGVTGTDGKSTTTDLITHLFNSFNMKALACGNIGLPFSQILYEQRLNVGVSPTFNFEYIIAELSSYQLEKSRVFHADVAIYLNVAPDHLNRYSSFEEYASVKWNIARNLGKKDLILASENLMYSENSIWHNSKNPFFKINPEVNKIDIKDNLSSRHFQWELNNESSIYTLYFYNEKKEKIVSQKDLQLKGRHNLTNILFAVETLYFFSKKDSVYFAKGKVNTIFLTKLKEALMLYKGLPHRFEFIHPPNTLTTSVQEKNSNIYINDSKATTTQAVIKALENVSSPVFIFMGGQGKGEDYSVLIDALQKVDAMLFLFGVDKKDLQETFQNTKVVIISSQETLEQVFQEAKVYQKKNNLKNVTYLLAPAMTSWDQYKSFEARGEHFRKLVSLISD